MFTNLFIFPHQLNPKNWFYAAQLGDAEMLGQLLSTCATRIDGRDTVRERVTFYGFAAIHYACYIDAPECVKVLFNKEFWMLTEEQVCITANGISPDLTYNLPVHQNCLQIALLRNSVNCIQAILQLLQQNPTAVAKFTNLHFKHLPTLATAAFCDYGHLLYETKLFNNQFAFSESYNLVRIALCANKKCIHNILNQSSEQLQIELYKMLLQITQGQSVYEIQIDDSIRDQLKNLLYQAAAYGEWQMKKNKSWAKLINEAKKQTYLEQFFSQ